MALDGNSEKCDTGSWLLMCGCGRVVVSAGDCLGFLTLRIISQGMRLAGYGLKKVAGGF